jgi:hypothetical protein
LKDIDVVGRIILIGIFKKLVWGRGGIDWIFLVQERDRWWVPVNAVMKFGVS